MTDLEAWLDRATNGASQRAIASAMGYQNTALSRWIRDDKMPAERVIEIARHYNQRIFDGLKAAHYLTDDDLAPIEVTEFLSVCDSLDLIDELRRREVVRGRSDAIPAADIEALVATVVARELGKPAPASPIKFSDGSTAE